MALASSAAMAVVGRHDVPQEKYLAAADAFPQLVDMPGAGHGVLIDPQWVVTAAHTIQSEIREVTLAGRPRAVVQVILHPGYRVTPQDMIDRALASNDATEVMQFLAANHDIALVRLAEPVSDVQPIELYSGTGELGRKVRMIGKGAIGDGLTGVTRGSSQRNDLRQGYNHIDVVKDRWIAFTFDRGRTAHRLEVMSGSGDSGGPILIKQRERWTLAGLVSWQGGNPDLSVPSARYGQSTYGVRLGYYAGWMKETMAASSQ